MVNTLEYTFVLIRIAWTRKNLIVSFYVKFARSSLHIRTGIVVRRHLFFQMLFHIKTRFEDRMTHSIMTFEWRGETEVSKNTLTLTINLCAEYLRFFEYYEATYEGKKEIYKEAWRNYENYERLNVIAAWPLVIPYLCMQLWSVTFIIRILRENSLWSGERACR